MFQNFLLKSMLKKQMKNVPQEQQDKILSAIEKNPDFFMNIAKEVQEKVKGGMSQHEAMMNVMQKYQGDLVNMMK